MNAVVPAVQQPPCTLKGTVATLSVLHVAADDIDRIEQRLRHTMAQVPGFFDGAPLLLDLAAAPATLALPALVARLRACGFVPVAVRQVPTPLAGPAEEAGLPAWPERTGAAAATPVEAPAGEAVRSAATSRVLTDPVRSGQQVHAEGDLVCLKGSSPGSELLADGNIHVYGPLRGRALAGLRGAQEARIFCQSLEAELIAIAGCYLIAEDMPGALRGQPVQIRQHEQELIIEPLVTR
ncbi:MAG: septum site-determining protein MinC [Pseudomonadota bacterium]|nr:septum site-determining protein MinC [Pseudomonadota bacterium]HJO36422.1 septum site-determining protein MinC [Gammaproteobacteria bacterium]